MGLAVLHSRALAGMHAAPVGVEVHLANGLPSFTIVGLPEAEVKESKDRIRAALQTAQFEFPARRITVNLAPADLPKESGRYDLPIALGILAASGQIPKDCLAEYEFAGELALTGELRPLCGGLAMTCKASRTGAHSFCPKIVPSKPLWCRMPRFMPPTVFSLCARTCAGVKSCRGPAINTRCSRNIIPTWRKSKARPCPGAPSKSSQPVGTAY